MNGRFFTVENETCADRRLCQSTLSSVFSVFLCCSSHFSTDLFLVRVPFCHFPSTLIIVFSAERQRDETDGMTETRDVAEALDTDANQRKKNPKSKKPEAKPKRAATAGLSRCVFVGWVSAGGGGGGGALRSTQKLVHSHSLSAASRLLLLAFTCFVQSLLYFYFLFLLDFLCRILFCFVLFLFYLVWGAFLQEEAAQPSEPRGVEGHSSGHAQRWEENWCGSSLGCFSFLFLFV